MSIATHQFKYLTDLISEQTGNVITPDQEYLVESRLGAVVRETGLPSIEQLVAELQSARGPELRDRVAEAMTVNETSFFRDPDMFDAVREHVIPDLITRRQSTRQLSIWCAASSSGQEPYSLAMLLKEHFPELIGWQVMILCTDYSERMVKRTREGSYTQFEVNRGLPARLLATHFDRRGLNWYVRDDLKQGLTFQTCNLTEAWPGMPTADLILLRNVMIYFDKPMKEQILSRVQRVLRPDGYLFLGGGETLVNLASQFQNETIGTSPAYRPIDSSRSQP